ncbi:MAG TPA: kelch repeat-containing protein [Marmoricola sp.]|nr:kelch repeat-containing protein [Marmoricola sp.]
MRAIRAAVAITVAAAAAASCSTARDEVGSPSGGEDAARAWHRLPDPPLSPRTHAVVVGVGDRMLVVGGWEFLCPPSADCAGPEGPLFDDGAVYDRATDSWSPIASPPFGVRRTEYATASLSGSAYLLTGCAEGPTCDARPRLISYDLDDNAWTDHGPVPGPKRHRQLVALGQTLLAYSGSDEHGEVADWVFDPGRGSWSELPDDPLPLTFDRFAVPVGDQLVLAGSSSAALDSGKSSGKLAARFDRKGGTWTRLPDAPGPGYQLLPADDGALLNGHFIDAPGWLVDPDTWTWSALPQQTGEQNDLAGVLGADRAVFDIPNSLGQTTSTVRVFAYDTVAEQFVTIPAPPGRVDVYDGSSTALGRDLFVLGGQRWAGDGVTGDGELVGDAWVWTAPPS